MKRGVLKLFLVLLLWVGALSCGEGLPGGDGIQEPQGVPENPLTPTPPVPVFGNFLLGVGTSFGPSPTAQAALGLPVQDSFLETQGVDLEGIRVNEIRKIVSQISFIPDSALQDPHPQGGCDRSHPNLGCKNTPVSEIQFPGNYVVQLIRDGQISNLTFPEFEPVRLPFDTYHTFELEFRTLPSVGIPPELLEDPLVTQFLIQRSLAMKGSFTLTGGRSRSFPGPQEIFFLLLSDQVTKIRTTSPNAFEVSSDRDNFFFMAFRVRDWLKGALALLQDTSPDDLEDGVLIISKDHPNPHIRRILSLIEDNIAHSIKSAPSEDGEFQEGDVDEDSFSIPF